MKFKLQELSVGQYLGWVFVSALFGLFMVYMANTSGALDSSDRLVPIAIFVFWWLVVVGLTRIYVQDKDPTDFKDLLGLKNKKQTK